MMALATDNKTLQLLRSFAQRRRRLIFLRGLAATTLVLLAAMFAVAIIDRFVIMSTPARLALSLAAYAAAVLIAWGTAARHLLRRDHPVELARMIERAEPALRDRLLAAIELGEWANGAAAFRAIVREDANRRAAEVKVERTLPWRLISWWVAAGAGAIALCGVLLSVPQLQFGRMLGRALLPTAEIRRASRYAVAFTGGVDGRLVPAGEASEFEVLVTGGQPRNVLLEIEPADRPGRSVPMTPAGDYGAGLLYRAQVSLDGPATLRAWADTADSQGLVVEVRPRPGVVSFTKSYTPPAYLLNHAQPTPPVTDDNGALEALHGSAAEVEIRADQPIRSGTITLLGNDGQPLAGSKPIELTPSELQPASGARAQRGHLSNDAASEHRLRASVPIQFDGAYRVDLVAAQTGFETRHAPIWPVRAILDLPPVVQAEAVDGRPVSADALLALRALVTDDVGLAWLRRDLRISGGEWQPGTLDEPGTAPTQISFSAPLDLLPLNVQPGDRVEARLVVCDLKGSEAVGGFGEWIIVADGVEDSRIQTLIAKQELSLATTRLAEALAQLQREIDGAIELVRQAGDADSVQLDQLWLSLATRSAAARTEALDVHAAAVGAMPRLTVGRDARDVERIGEAASVIRRQIDQIAVLAESSGQPPAQRLSASRSLASPALDLSGAAATLAQTLVTTEQAALAARELRLTFNESAQQLTELLSGAAGPRGPDEHAAALQQLSRGAAATAGRLQGARERLDEVRAALATDRDALARIDEVRTLADRSAERLRRALRSNGGESLLEPMLRVRDSIDGALKTVGEIAVILEQRLAHDRQRLQVPPTAAALRELASQVPGGSGDFDDAIARLGERAMLHERRVEFDAALLSDLTLAQRAVRAMALASQQLEDPAAVSRRSSEVAAATLVLETGHEVAELRLRVSAMHEAERTEPDRWSLDRWRDWLSLGAELSGAAARLASGGHDPQAVASLTRLTDQRAGRMYAAALQRPDDPAARQSALASLAEMVEQLKTIQDAIAPRMREARQVLAKDAITLADWMHDLAEQARAMSQRTRTAATAEQAADEQQDFDEKVRELEEAIRRDAAQQDLLSEAGRQRARDADDATAMLRNDATARRERMQAAQAASEDQRPQAMDAAADAQQQSSQTLSKLAEHYRNLQEAPQAAEQSRQALREQEDELGIKQRLDDEYERMERLADMQDLDDQQMLEALEQELAHDEAMQRELGKLADEAARQGQQQLDSAAQAEQQIQRDLERTADMRPEQQRVAEDQSRRLEQIAQAAKQDLPNVADRLEKLPEEMRSAGPLEQARQALEEAADAARESDVARAAEAFEEARDALAQIEQEQRKNWQESAAQMNEAAQKAAEARNTGVPDPEAESQRESSAQQAQAASNSRVAAQRTRSQAERGLEQAQQMLQDQQQAQEDAREALERAAESQDQIAQEASGGAKALERAARHEQRLGNQQKSSAMQQAAQGAQQAAQEQVPAAAQAARQAQQPSDAMQPVQDASQALQQQAQAARDASGLPDQSASPAAADRTGSMMAQALDRLDRALNSQSQQGNQRGQQPGQQAQQANAQQPGQPQGQQQGSPQTSQTSDSAGQPSAQLARALAQRAADAQARSMRNRRMPSMPSMPPNAAAGTGADLQSMFEGEMEADRPEEGGDWGRLPPEVVKDLMQGQRDVAPAEYRDLVEAYYRAIAERARRGQ